MNRRDVVRVGWATVIGCKSTVFPQDSASENNLLCWAVGSLANEDAGRNRPGFDGSTVARGARFDLLKKRSHFRRVPKEFLCVDDV